MFEPYSVNNETEARKIARDLRENIKNVITDYEASAHSGFDVSVKTVYRLGTLLEMADSAISWLSTRGKDAKVDYPLYMNDMIEGVEYLKSHFPKTLDDRLMNAVSEEGLQPYVEE
jgi:hypothetical protein